jgi:hypothetical protein
MGIRKKMDTRTQPLLDILPVKPAPVFLTG